MQNTKPNILIIGMPLSGKSTIGKCLGKKLRINFDDLDEFIEKKTKESIYRIIKKYGEQKFRVFETTYFKEIIKTRKEQHILALGGGTVHANCFSLFNNYSIRIWLKSNIDTLVNRHENSNNKRPLLDSSNIKSYLENLYSIRKKIYQEHSNLCIEVDNKSVQLITNEIANKINEKN